MVRQAFVRLGWLALAVLVVACQGGSSTPLSPSGAMGAPDAAADGTTLKATAPVPVSPVNEARVETLRPTLEVTNAVGKYASATFTYRFELYEVIDTPRLLGTEVVAQGDGRTSVSVPTDLRRDTVYQWRARGELGSTVGPWSSTAVFRTPLPPSLAPPPGRYRTPDPPPGQRLPLPNMEAVVREIARQYPSALQNTCVRRGGSWEFMDRLVERLREFDLRWAYNGKRGNANDTSEDVVDYHYAAGASEGSTQVYLIDVIVGLCGSDPPRPGWLDVTDETRRAGTIGRWVYPRPR